MTSQLASMTGTSFTRNRVARAATGIASAGIMVGISMVAAAPAMAATDADCLAGNTVDATTGVPADIQTLLDANTSVICLSGTFVLSTALTYDYDVTIHGLTNAVLDGDGVTRILEDQREDDFLTIENMRLTNGNAVSETFFDEGHGGAIRGSVVVVYNSQFDNNSADTWGGAIQAYAVDIYDSLFFDNEAGYAGGAVQADEYVGMTRTTFRTNVADIGGAIAAYGVAESVSSTFEENDALYEGGAIYAEDRVGDGTVDVQNSTFVGNSTSVGSSGGGAISTMGGAVRQSTFLDNTTAADAGQSIVLPDGDLSLRGNIFAGTGSKPHLSTFDGAIVDAGANLFTTTEAAEVALSSAQPTSQFALTTAALFDGATLANNGGPTETVALYNASPALSAVPADPDSMTEDQRGVARPAVSDAGAYEYTGALAVLAATGSAPSGWLAGAAGLLLAAGAAVVAMTRRTRRAL